MNDRLTRLEHNLARVRQAMAEAAERSGRAADAVTLVAVTKYVDAEVVQALIEAGCHELGESRPQQLWEKVAALPAEPNGAAIRWHMIGHLQRNKIARTLPLVSMIQSLDRDSLVTALDHTAAVQQRVIDVLLQVNISGEAAKQGWAAADLPQVVERVAACNQLRIRGLMAMASLAGGREEARREFAQLRHLRDSLLADCPDGILLDELSMGMSRDFDVAIEEGATMVRVGSLLYEGIL